jgi:mRNA interferase MazF
MARRGDVVIITFPFVGGGGAKKRPAAVVQADRLNAKLTDTIVAVITSNLSRIGKEPSQFLIDPTSPGGQSSGLRHASVVKCINLFTIQQDRFSRESAICRTR